MIFIDSIYVLCQISRIHVLLSLLVSAYLGYFESYIERFGLTEIENNFHPLSCSRI